MLNASSPNKDKLFLVLLKRMGMASLTCEFMNFSSPNNLPYQTSKYTPQALNNENPCKCHGPLFRSIAE